MIRSLAVTVALVVAGPVVAADPPPTWVGEKVFARRPGTSRVAVEAVDAKPGGPKLVSGLMYLDYTVTAEDRTHVTIRLEVGGVPARGRIAKAEVVALADAPDYFTKMLKSAPKWDAAWIQRGWANHLLDKQDEARKDYDLAVAARPDDWFVWNNRGLIRTAAGDLDGAVGDFDEAVKRAPTVPGPLCNRGRVRLVQKDFSAAFREFDAAIALDANYGSAYLDRGRAHEGMGEFDAALRDAETAARLLPDKPWGQARLAWLLATHPDAAKRDGAKAVAAGKLAVERGHEKEGEGMAALAAAYAESGDFPKAVEWQMKALADVVYRKESGPLGETLREGYAAKKPHRLVKP